jgi:signal transduction histidine kinase
VGADVGRFPEDVEAAVYFCCLEAMQNAAKHAGDGARVTLTIGRSGGGDGNGHGGGDGAALEFTVADDGVGFDVEGSAGLGHGFVNMSDRVGAVGGTLTVDSSVGAGTRITGTIPVRPA